MSLPADHDAIAAQLGPYFDGELTPDDELVVLEHLADCERCQAALDDLMGMHVALGRKTDAAGAAMSPAAPATVAAPPTRHGATVVPLASRRRRRTMVLGGMALVAAAAAAAVVVWGPGRGRRGEPQLALAPTRPVEVRFTARDFADHRPYRVDRGSADIAPISLATLSALERRGDRAALVAALAWSGDRSRAAAVLDRMPDAAAVEADRAGLLVLIGQPEPALAAADRALVGAESTAVARWNRALALRDLHLALAAAQELDRVAVADQRGWADEATALARALRAEAIGRRAVLTDAAARRRAGLAGGAPLTASDVAIAPTEARVYFHEALRMASTPAAIDALASLAAALDRLSGGEPTTRELARVRATDLAVRRPFAERYREVTKGSLAPATLDAFIDDLARAGTAVDDIRLGVILTSGQLGKRVREVDAITRGSGYPLFELLGVQARFAAGSPEPGDRELAASVCANPAWALRCGAIDRWDAVAKATLGLLSAADQAATRAVERFRIAAAPVQEDDALAFRVQILRQQGRLSLASAISDELVARLSSDDCTKQRYLATGLAELLRRQGRVGRARELLVDPDACPAGIDAMAIGAAVDIARDTGAAEDVELAARWIAAARGAGLSASLCDVADARLHIAAQRERSRALLAGFVAAPGGDQLGRATADWAWRTLIVDDGAHGDWQAAFEHTLAAVGQAGPTTCAIALAADDAIQTAAWRDANGNPGGAQWKLPAPWPALPTTALAGCATTAVIAMSPLHGRPPPWSLGAWAWSTGRPPAAPSPARGDALVIAATAPPHELLDLPNLAPVAIPPGARGLTGVDATPARVAAAMATATYVEIHAHGLVDLDTDDGGFIALSPDGDGDWRLSASDLRGVKLAGAPVVVLAACRAAEAAPDQLRRWSLPDAFLAAGARAVIAADVAVPDDLIRLFVDDVRARLERGESPATSAAAARATLVAADPRRATWVDRLMVFE